MGRRFVAERRRDPYYRAAQREGLRSRAAYKLEYLDQRFRLLRPGFRVLDLGAAPGGWSLVAAAAVGARGDVVAVDLRSLEPIAGVRTVRGRVGDAGLASRLGSAPFDLVLSDLSPRISGAYATDHARSVALAREGFALARSVLAVGGSFVAKVFDGDLVEGLAQELAAVFERVQRTKPPASREASSELYLVARGFRGRPGEVPPARGSAI
ncbi:MAG TPA: RlmE family RNA methyltransferase [Thermoplasmata archaeon]|nr:RlmE family RNA methyltransferase [Thermoplasmata archaeon]